ncbi:MAG: (Fe-S)-binding protein [Deltaproteobacteria bacterium]|nr:(Fe-S)-binding protein [Deltaproteobacteria bacterium]
MAGKETKTTATSGESIAADINSAAVWALLEKYRFEMRMALRVCAHCGLCAESCFLYMARDRKPEYMPSHKFINTLGILYRKKGRVRRKELESMCHIAWRRCVLCTRCYCPLGINIPEMIALVRRVCRSQNVLPDFENTSGWEKRSHGQSYTKTAE